MSTCTLESSGCQAKICGFEQCLPAQREFATTIVFLKNVLDCQTNKAKLSAGYSIIEFVFSVFHSGQHELRKYVKGFNRVPHLILA